ncbi:hypothetical protein ABT369_38575 [Dactylosporangium sp. NPDC000244]|uniref:hypothetical protein n=1 Tax=Dactylosporangium sp. NPDC000244 TaxID=3154365 RepID=UPI003330EB66
MDPLMQALADLHEHADVFTRYRAVLPHGTVKGVSLTDALNAVAEHGGRAERSEAWLLPSGHELLCPWEPIREEPS